MLQHPGLGCRVWEPEPQTLKTGMRKMQNLTAQSSALDDWDGSKIGPGVSWLAASESFADSVP